MLECDYNMDLFVQGEGPCNHLGRQAAWYYAQEVGGVGAQILHMMDDHVDIHEGEHVGVGNVSNHHPVDDSPGGKVGNLVAGGECTPHLDQLGGVDNHVHVPLP